MNFRNIRDPRTNRMTDSIVMDADSGEYGYSQDYFAQHSEHIILETLEADEFGPALALSETINGENGVSICNYYTGWSLGE